MLTVVSLHELFVRVLLGSVCVLKSKSHFPKLLPCGSTHQFHPVAAHAQGEVSENRCFDASSISHYQHKAKRHANYQQHITCNSENSATTFCSAHQTLYRTLSKALPLTLAAAG